jgi:hypothetical protein
VHYEKEILKEIKTIPGSPSSTDLNSHRNVNYPFSKYVRQGVVVLLWYSSHESSVTVQIPPDDTF